MENAKEAKVASLEVCNDCKAEVRPHSEFCYNCGKKIRKDDGTGSTLESISIGPANGTIKTGRGNKSLNDAKPGSRVRRRSAPSAEPIQVTWKREENVGMSFILLCVGAAFFAILMIAVAYYLR